MKFVIFFNYFVRAKIICLQIVIVCKIIPWVLFVSALASL